MEKSKNQQGFSLVELIIAVAIFAIVIIPFALAFMTSVTLNKQTKTLQRANLAATNVMEFLRASNPNELINKYALTQNAQGVYTYSEVQTIDGKKYTAVASLDPTYQNTSLTDEATDYNASQLAEVYSMDAATDSAFAVTSAMDQQAALELANQIYPAEKDYLGENTYTSTIAKGFYRNVVFTISKNSDVTQVNVSISYSYQSGKGVFSTDQKTQCIYSGNSNEVTLKNIYYFFHAVEGSEAYSPRENVTIVNNALQPLNIYMIEQNQSSEYGMNLRLLETSRTTGSMIVDGQLVALTKIHSNLEEKQVTARYATRPNAYSSNYTIGGHNYTALQMMEYVGGSAGAMTSSNVNSVYKVTLKLYEGEGDDKKNEAIVTLKSTIQ